MLTADDLVMWDIELSMDDKSEVGLEIATLSELSRNKVKVLPHFIITSYAFDLFLKDNNLDTQLKHLLGTLNHARHDSLDQISKYAQKLIRKSPIHKNIYQPLFRKAEKYNSSTMNVTAYYFRNKKSIGSEKWGNLKGEAVLLEHVREAWAHLYTIDNLKRHSIHHENHYEFSVVIVVSPNDNFSLTGYIKTQGERKHEYEIEAHSMVKFTYNKTTNLVEKGHLLPGGDKKALSAVDIKKLLSYASISDKVLYFPQKLDWVKHDNSFFVIKATPLSTLTDYNDSYNSLLKSITVHPGITIGRLRVIDEKNKEALIMNDEIVMLKSLNKQMMTAIKKAKGIIIEEDPHPEIVQLLKSYGIPTLIHKNKMFIYSTGDVVSLNATTGEIKKGSMLVS